MRKILTLAAAVLTSFSLWAASEKFPTTIAPLDVDAVATAGEYVFTCSSANITAEADKASGWIGWTSTQSAYKDYDKSGSATCMGTQTKIPNLKYDAITFYVQNCSGFCMHAWANGSSRSVTLTYAEYPDGTETVKSFTEASNTDCAHSDTIALDATKTYYIKASNGNAEEIGITYLYLFGPTCNSPANPLVLSSDAAETVYVGDVINLSTTGGNGAGIGVEGTADETLGGYAGLTWTATAGEHTFVATQDAYNGYCAQESELVFNVLEKNPVTACSITGPTAGYAGYELTYTATAANASDYQWLVDGIDANTNAASFTYTGVKGEHSIVCKARNDFNATDEWIASDPIALTVTKLCGELIKATHTGAKTADVTGVVGGTVDKNTQDGGKLGSNGNFFGIKLESGSFMAGDVVTCVATALSGGNTATLFSDKGTTPLGSAEFDTESKTATITLTKSADWIYLYRADGNVCNPTMGSISVTRSCEDSNDATIHSLTVNGNEVAENNGLFEYTLSASYEEPTVTIAFEIHPLATIKYDLSNPYELTTPDLGDSRGQAFTIIAEDGTEKTYTVQIYKSASLSDDATLKALSVAGLTLDPAFAADVTEYTVTKAYEAAMPEVSAVTATPNSSDAKGAEVTITGNVITIVVTAENDDTKTYTITVNNAPAVKKINEVILSNGYSAYIVEGQSVEPFVINGFYLAGQDAPTVSSYQVNDGTTWAIDGNNITLTGADNSIALYSLVLAEVAPVEFSADEITFDGTEAWVKAANSFDASKGGWKFSKTDSDFSREIAGKTHVEFFLPACDTIVLKAGADGTERDVRFYVNGTEVGDKAKLTKAGVTLVVEQANPFMLTVASAQTGGDGGVGAIRMAKAAETPTAISNTEAEVKAVKFIENGQFFIIKNGIKYNANGVIVK